MISKELFCDIINHIEDIEIMANEMNEVFEKHTSNDFFDAAGLIDFNIIDLTIKALEEMFHDPDDWITWWMYETNYGYDEESNTVYHNGEVNCLLSPGDLYDFLYEYYYSADIL